MTEQLDVVAFIMAITALGLAVAGIVHLVWDTIQEAREERAEVPPPRCSHVTIHPRHLPYDWEKDD